MVAGLDLWIWGADRKIYHGLDYGVALGGACFHGGSLLVLHWRTQNMRWRLYCDFSEAYASMVTNAQVRADLHHSLLCASPIVPQSMHYETSISGS